MGPKKNRACLGKGQKKKKKGSEKAQRRGPNTNGKNCHRKALKELSERGNGVNKIIEEGKTTKQKKRNALPRVR